MVHSVPYLRVGPLYRLLCGVISLLILQGSGVALAQSPSQDALSQQAVQLLSECQCASGDTQQCANDPEHQNRCAAACIRWGSAVVNQMEGISAEPRTHRQLELVAAFVVVTVLILIGVFLASRGRVLGVGATLACLFLPGLLAVLVGFLVNRLPASAGDKLAEVGRALNTVHGYSQDQNWGVGCSDTLAWFLEPNTGAYLPQRVLPDSEFVSVLGSEATVPAWNTSVDDLPQDTGRGVVIASHRNLFGLIEQQRSAELSGMDWVRDHRVVRGIFVDRMQAWGSVPVAGEADFLMHLASRLAFGMLFPLVLALLVLAGKSFVWRRSQE